MRQYNLSSLFCKFIARDCFENMQFIVDVLVALSSAKADYSPQIIDADNSIPKDGTKMCNQMKNQFQTSYPMILCQLAVSNGIFDKLYDIPMELDEVGDIVSNVALYFAESLGLPNENMLPTTLSEAAKEAYPHYISPMDYFRIYQKTLEDVLLKEGLLTEEKSQALAERNYKALEDSLKSFDFIGNPFSMMYALTNGNTNFLKSVGDMSPENIKFMMKSITDEIKRI